MAASDFRARRLRRLLWIPFLALPCLALLLGARCGGGSALPARLAPSPGAPEYQALAFVAVPGGFVNAAGGNLLVERVDLTLDSRLGREGFGAVFNAASRRWRFGFEVELAAGRFVDASGAPHELAGLAPGDAIPGTHFVREAADAVATKGGLVHRFDASGRLVAAHWRSSPWPRIEYLRASLPQQGERIVAIQQRRALAAAPEPLFLLSWSGGRLEAVVDRAGRRVEYDWDAQGRLVAVRGARALAEAAQVGPGWHYAYGGDALVAVTNPEGERVEYAYADGRVVSVRAVGAEHPEWLFRYSPRDSEGRYATRVRDPQGQDHVVRYDGARRVVELESPLGERVRFGWLGRRPHRREDAAGVVTRLAWAQDDPVQVHEPSGNTIELVYAPGATDRSSPTRRPLLRAEDDLGPIEARSYDAAGRLVAIANGAGETTALGWGAGGELVSVVEPGGRLTELGEYGADGHARRIERAGVVYERVFDAVGNRVRGPGGGGETDPEDPGVIERGFDAARRVAWLRLAETPAASSFPVARELRIERRSDGRPLRITRPYGADSEFVYDAVGRLVERRDRSDGAWRTTQIARDALGRARRVERPNGTWTEQAFDAAGRRTRLASGRGAELESEALFEYAAGRLVSITDARQPAPEVYGYDAAGRIQHVDFPHGERLQLGFDPRSRTVSELYLLPPGAGPLRALGFAYDAADREVEVWDGAELRLRRHYQHGRLVETQSGNGLVRRAVYDEEGLIQSATLRDAGGALVAEETLVRGVVTGLAARVHWSVVAESFAGVEARAEESFLLGPLSDSGVASPGVQLAAFSPDPQPYAPRFFGWDALGGALGSIGQSFVYDPEHTRLLEIRAADGALEHHYRHDEAGFVIERDGVAIEWWADGRIAAVGSALGFEWDALGRPVESFAAGILRSFRFGGRVLADASGNPLALDGPELHLDLAGGQHRYLHHDFRGNVRFVSDASAAIVSLRRYGPHGRDALFGVEADPRGFAGGAELADLVLLGGRLYDPAAARFLAPDPIYSLRSQHAYAAGNAIWFWDPGGASKETALSVARGVALGAMAAGALVAGAAATPALAVAGLVLTVSAAGVIVGLSTPASGTARSVAIAVSTTLAAMGGPFRVAALAPAGFVVGADLQQSIASDFSPPAPAPPSDGPGFTKELELHAVPPAAGCGATPLGLPGLPDLRVLLGVLLPLQLVLGLWLWARR